MAGGQEDNTPTHSRRDAKVAGASVGTGVAAFAQLLPEGWARSLLDVIAPTVTVVLAMVWPHIREWLEWRTIRIVNRVQMRSALKEARAHRDTVLANPDATAATKRHAQENVDKLEELFNQMLDGERDSLKERIMKRLSVRSRTAPASAQPADRVR